MHEIHRLTPHYDPNEDRLRLDVLTRDNQVLSMWLTHRLAVRLVKALAGTMDEVVKRMAAGRSDPALHAFEQGSALAQHRKTPAVQAQGAIAGGLVREVQIQRDGARYLLTFACHAGDASRLQLGVTEARQLLAFLRRMFGVADWSTAGFPSWLDEPSAAAASAPAERSALH